MMDALTICGFVAAMRHAGYLSLAAAVLGVVGAHYRGLRRAVLRASAWLMHRDVAAERPGPVPEVT